MLGGQVARRGGRRRPARSQGRRPRRPATPRSRSRSGRPVRQPRRPQARGRARRVRDRSGGPGLPRCRRLDRRLHRRPAPARRARVHAVDVGRGQLAESLRHDPRVVSMERTNARTLTADDAARADRPRGHRRLVHLARPRPRRRSPRRCAPAPAPIVALVKPQFEAGRGGTDHGVVRDPAVHRAVLARVGRRAPRQLGLGRAGVDRLADPRARRATASSSSTSRPVRLRGHRRADRRGGRRRREGAGDASRGSASPTTRRAMPRVELRERAAAGAGCTAIDHWAAPGRRLRRARSRAARRPTSSSSSAATARSCGPRGP